MHFCAGLPIILVGCKKDLRRDPRVIEELRKTSQRPVTPEEVCRLLLPAFPHVNIVNGSYREWLWLRRLTLDTTSNVPPSLARVSARSSNTQPGQLSSVGLGKRTSTIVSSYKSSAYTRCLGVDSVSPPSCHRSSPIALAHKYITSHRIPRLVRPYTYLAIITCHDSSPIPPRISYLAPFFCLCFSLPFTQERVICNSTFFCPLLFLPLLSFSPVYGSVSSEPKASTC